MIFMGKLKVWFEDNFSKVKFYDYILWKNYLSVLGIIVSDFMSCH